MWESVPLPRFSWALHWRYCLTELPIIPPDLTTEFCNAAKTEVCTVWNPHGLASVMYEVPRALEGNGWAQGSANTSLPQTLSPGNVSAEAISDSLTNRSLMCIRISALMESESSVIPSSCSGQGRAGMSNRLPTPRRQARTCLCPDRPGEPPSENGSTVGCYCGDCVNILIKCSFSLFVT